MTPVFGARRRAEEFNSLVEGPSTGELRDARHAEFLDIVASLRDVPEAEARPAFVADLRSQLMTAADTVLVASDDEAPLGLRTRREAPRTRERRIAAAAAGLAVVGATTSMAMAAQSALPGDALYPIKRLIEGAETGLAVNEGEKGSTLLASASGRLEEITALSREQSLDNGDAIATTLNDFTRQSIAASDLLLTDYATTGDERSIAELRDFTGESMSTLTELESVVPDQARDELLRAARVLTQIDAEAQRACPSCGGDGIGEIPAILTSSFDSSSAGVVTTPGTVLKAAPEKQNPRKRPGRTQAAVPSGSALPPGSVLTPPDDQAAAGASTGGGATQQGSSDPVEDLTETLAGSGGDGGGSEPASGPGLPASSDLEDLVEDVTDPLLHP